MILKSLKDEIDEYIANSPPEMGKLSLEVA
jgi:hypothetical protein